MSNLLAPGVGAVLSADIAVPEHERVMRFYSRVLGSGDDPLWRDDLMNNLGMPIIGLGARTDELSHLPLQWMPHIQVADVAASARRALGLGGRELMHARDGAGESQWAVLLDPQGAAFGIIPVVPGEAIPPTDASSGSPAGDRVGRIAWLDLTVPDAGAAQAFYREVAGWRVEEVAMKDGGAEYHDYNLLDARGVPVAGACHARGPNTGIPPVWMIYLPVGDLSESLRRVEAEGGTVIKAIRGADGAHIHAVIKDPVGACMALAPG